MKIIRGIFLGILVLLAGAPSINAASFPSWAFSIKAGAYQPNEDNYGANYGNPRAFRGDLELGYNITRQIQTGVSVGFFIDNGHALGAISGTPSGVEQQLILIPTQLYLLYQFGFREGQVVVPYLGGGYTHMTYHRSVDGQGSATGGKEGYHGRAGLKFLLNAAEPRAADQFRESLGVYNTYFLLEGQYARVDNFGGSSTDLGGWSYFAGLQFEF